MCSLPTKLLLSSFKVGVWLKVSVTHVSTAHSKTLEWNEPHLNIWLDKIMYFPLEYFVIQNKLFREGSSHQLVTVPVDTEEFCTAHTLLDCTAGHLGAGSIAHVDVNVSKCV